MDETGSLIY
jgi:hypothetical protein